MGCATRPASRVCGCSPSGPLRRSAISLLGTPKHGLAPGTCSAPSRSSPPRTRTPPLEVQVFGVHKSAETRAALRFFAERRVKVHFVDLREHAASVGELRRFAQKLGI